MEFIFEKIHVPHEHSFITRELTLQEDSAKIHSHKNFELNLITSGSGRRIVGNNISSFETGDLVLMAPELPHCWEILDHNESKPPSCIVIHFYENIISSDFFNIPELETVIDLLNKAGSGLFFKGSKVRKVKESLKRLVDLQGLPSYIELLKVFNTLLDISDREALSHTSDYLPSFTKNLNQINSIYEYVFKNIQEGVKLEEAAGILNMVPGSFCRYFKKKTGRTFMQYVKEVRIGLAAKMLAETDKPVSQICFECGYNNLANFNFYFKKIMGETPSEYRKNFR